LPHNHLPYVLQRSSQVFFIVRILFWRKKNKNKKRKKKTKVKKKRILFWENLWAFKNHQGQAQW
jgi:hypothetical protein